MGGEAVSRRPTDEGCFSDCFVECPAYNVRLLLRCKLDEVYGIARYTDRQLGIVLGMLLCIEERITVEYVNVKMMAALGSIAVK